MPLRARRSTVPLVPCVIVSCLLATGGLATSARAGAADDPGDHSGGAHLLARVDGGTPVRGHDVVLQAWFEQSPDRCYHPDGAGSWAVDGVPLPGTGVSPGAPADPPPGVLPPGGYFLDQNLWDSGTVPDGVHRLTVTYGDRDCADPATAYTVVSSLDVTVDNAPTGIALPTLAVVRGTSARLPITLTTHGSAVTQVDVTGDIVDGGTASEQAPPYVVPLDLTRAGNGRHSITVAVTDASGTVTSATGTVVVDNHRVLRLDAQRRARRGALTSLRATVSPVGGTVPLLVQQLAGRRWRTVGRAVVGPSGRQAVRVRCPASGSRQVRVTTLSTTVFPGTSRPVTLRCG